jgi:hypothetical protein
MELLESLARLELAYKAFAGLPVTVPGTDSFEMVQPTRIELVSMVLQTTAITISAKVAYVVFILDNLDYSRRQV